MNASYTAEPLRCHACEARDHAAQEWGRDENASTHGLFFAVHADEDDDGGEP